MAATKKKRTEPSDVGNVFNKPSPVDFELPDWRKSKEYTYIKQNIYLTKKNKRRREDDGIFCSCSPGSPSVCGCSSLVVPQTVNVKFMSEQTLPTPACEEDEANTEKCGSGIVASEDIKQGEFVIEYVGEVIDDKTCEERLWIMKHCGETKFYMCEINRDMVIDAMYKGNILRYINHSRCPNTVMQKWIIDGESRMDIFATCDIKKGDYLTYDYQFVQFGADQDCHCGAVGCREKLGVRPAKPKMSSVAASTCQKTGSLLGELGTEAASTVKKGDGKSKLKLDESSSFSAYEDLTTGGANAEIAAIKIQENGVEKTTKVSIFEDPADDGHAEATAMEVEVAGAGISAKTHHHDRPLLLCGVGSENTLEGSSNPGGTAKSPLHEQYLSLNVDEMHSGHTTEGLSNGTETTQQQNEVAGRQDESGMTGREHTPHHPFEKKSPFWKMLESMDAFKRFPQQPHFQPLLKIKMVFREGRALGRMHIFSAVVEDTSKLQVDDPSNSINDILEALVEPEQMGFDVKVLQDHLNHLQVMKLRFAELKNKSNEVKRWKVIRGMDVEINDLEDKLREIQAERANMVADVAAKYSEISILESEANAINGNIQSVKHDFQTLASAAW